VMGRKGIHIIKFLGEARGQGGQRSRKEEVRRLITRKKERSRESEGGDKDVNWLLSTVKLGGEEKQGWVNAPRYEGD